MSSNKQSLPFFICAQQRSGTTVLHKTLGQTPLFTDFGEVFHTHRANGNINFFNFKEHQIGENPKLVYPSRDHQMLLIEKYLANVAQHSSTKYHILDVKYNSWHHFNPVWQNICERPLFLKYIMDSGMPILHLIRKNTFEQYISSKVAIARNKFHYNKEEQPDRVIIQVDPKSCKKAMDISKQNTIQFDKWFAGYRFVKNFYYEDLIDNNQFSDSLIKVLEDLLKERFEKKIEVALRKATKGTPKDFIENVGEIESYFQGTEYEDMINSALS